MATLRANRESPLPCLYSFRGFGSFRFGTLRLMLMALPQHNCRYNAACLVGVDADLDVSVLFHEELLQLACLCLEDASAGAAATSDLAHGSCT